MIPYLLDANAFIAAKNLHYGFDSCPAFWDWLIESNAAGKGYSIEKVGDEVSALADELSDWASARGTGFFLRPHSAVDRCGFPLVGDCQPVGIGTETRTRGGEHFPATEAEGRFPKVS